MFILKINTMKKEDNQSSSLFEQKRYKAPENSDGVKKIILQELFVWLNPQFMLMEIKL